MLISIEQEEELPLGSNGVSVTGHHVMLAASSQNATEAAEDGSRIRCFFDGKSFTVLSSL